jgi:hypothetical protein
MREGVRARWLAARKGMIARERRNELLVDFGHDIPPLKTRATEAVLPMTGQHLQQTEMTDMSLAFAR